MSFYSGDLASLVTLLREPDYDSDDSESDHESKPSFASSKSGPGQIGAKKETGGSGDAKSSGASASKQSQIWTPTDVARTEQQVKADSLPIPVDPRKTPSYEMFYRQAVTSEDVFLQMGYKTPGTASCENLVVVIHLPGEEDFDKMQLNLKDQAIDLRTPTHFLNLGLPHPIDTKEGNAKWDPDQEKLTVTLRLSRELDKINF